MGRTTQGKAISAISLWAASSVGADDAIGEQGVTGSPTPDTCHQLLPVHEIR